MLYRKKEFGGRDWFLDKEEPQKRKPEVGMTLRVDFLELDGLHAGVALEEAT